ncbi:MAG: ankyrin repeat domain-containing protein [Mollicutes bacterium UO1]
MHYFTAQGNLTAVKILIDSWKKNSLREIVIQQRLNIKGNRELSPLHIAVSFNREEIAGRKSSGS